MCSTIAAISLVADVWIGTVRVPITKLLEYSESVGAWFRRRERKAAHSTTRTLTPSQIISETGLFCPPRRDSASYCLARREWFAIVAHNRRVWFCEFRCASSAVIFSRLSSTTAWSRAATNRGAVLSSFFSVLRGLDQAVVGFDKRQAVNPPTVTFGVNPDRLF